MKRVLFALLVLIGSLAAQTTTYTGTVRDLSGALTGIPGAAVTSGNVTFTQMPSVDTTISGVSRFVPLVITCGLDGTGAVKAADLVSPCIVTQNTALTPSGTSYKVCIQPFFTTPGSCFVDYATVTTKDISTVVPTPQLSPSYNFSLGSFALGVANTWTAPQVGSFAGVFDCKLYAVANGTTDDGGHINTCIANAVSAGYGTIKLPSGQIHVVTPINLTNRSGLTITGAGSDFYSHLANGSITEIMCDTGTVCLDTAGSRSMKFKDFAMRISNAYSTPSNVAILEGRTASNGGTCFSEDNVWDHVPIWTDHSTINSGRGYIGIYNVGGEVRKYTSGYISADTPMMFMTTNLLGLTSPYEALGTSCPASMTIVEIGNTTLQSTYGHGIESWTTADFNLHDIDFLMASGTVGRSVMPISFNGTYATKWHVLGHVEWLNQNNSLMSWGATTMQANTFAFNLGGSTQLGDTHGYIAWPSAGFSVGENTVVLDLHNEPAGYERPFFSNASAQTINGGTYVLTGSLKGFSESNITLNGSKLIATDFTLAQAASYNAASTYDVLTSTGLNKVGTFQLSGPFTVSNGADSTSNNILKCGLTADQACQINFLDRLGNTIGILQKTAGNGITLTRGTSSLSMTAGATEINDQTGAGIVFNDAANATGLTRFFGGGASPVERVRITDAGLRADLTNGAFIKSTLNGAATLTYTAIAANTCQEQTMTVTGATAGKPAFFSPGATLGSTNLSFSSWVSATNTVSVRVCNPTVGSITPSAVSWNGWVLQ